MKKRILFISHDASRTGAPIILLNYLKFLKNNYPEVYFEVLLKDGGDLYGDFQLVTETIIWNKYPNKFDLRNLRKYLIGLFYKKIHQQKILKRLKERDFNLLYVNSVASLDTFNDLRKKIKAKTILHVHELEISIKEFAKNSILEEAFNHIDKFIAVSEAVKKNLILKHRISESKITRIYGFVPTDILLDNEFNLRKELNINEDAFVVCGSGTTDWRKGPDIFIQVAKRVNEVLNEPVYFIWIGGEKEGINYEKLRYDVIKFGLQKEVFFLGKKKNPHDYFSQSNIFVLTSREDPFPLVCLEAASLAKPVLCFESAGGMQEFVTDDCGCSVPYLSIFKMAEEIISFFNNKEKTDFFGKNAKNKIQNNHNIVFIGKKLTELILK